VIEAWGIPSGWQAVQTNFLMAVKSTEHGWSLEREVRVGVNMMTSHLRRLARSGVRPPTKNHSDQFMESRASVLLPRASTASSHLSAYHRNFPYSQKSRNPKRPFPNAAQLHRNAPEYKLAFLRKNKQFTSIPHYHRTSGAALHVSTLVKFCLNVSSRLWTVTT
jgi:hypothetical protein